MVSSPKIGQFTSSDKSSKSSVSVTQEVEKRIGKVPLLGRYHQLPRKLDDDFKLTGKTLGSGMNGAVNMAVRKNSPEGESFAVKEFDMTRIAAKGVAALESEVQVFLCLDHPHICRLVNVYQTPKSLSLVMECMAGGELFDRVSEKKKFPEPQAANVMQQMLLAVHYLHSHGIVHRDIKLENFVYDAKDGDVLKLIDFGFSKFRERGAKMRTACGTLSYVAPEVLTDSYTSQCDLWSLGVIVYILLCGSMPFSGDSSVAKAKIAEGSFTFKKEKWKDISQSGKQFTEALMQKDPNVRLTTSQALEHPWLQSNLKAPSVGFDKSMMLAFQEYRKAPKFRRCCLLAMAWLLPSKDTEEMRKEFFAIDTDRQGTISLGELRTLMVERFNAADHDVVNTFKAMDVNHDDEIHYSEFLAAMLSTRIKLNDKLLDSTFRNLDKDLSGYITAENLRDCFGESFEGRPVESLVSEADVLKDGKISYPEFAAFIRGAPLESKASQLSYPVEDSKSGKDCKIAQQPKRRATTQVREIEDVALKETAPCCCVM